MPVEGYKSLTLPDVVYDTLFERYKKEKSLMKLKGIFSFSAYVTWLLDSELSEAVQGKKERGERENS